MKLSNVLTCAALLLTSASAFTVPSAIMSSNTRSSLTRQYMFGGGGGGIPTEDDPEAQAQMEAAAKSMGMSVEEYQLGIKARMKLNEELSSMRIETGNTDTVSIRRDGNNPPQLLEISVTDKGKELGKEGVSKELVAALKQGAEQSRKGRAEAQKGMMVFIQEEMKKIEK